MKSNLDKLFKTSESFEKEGIWLNITEESGFLVKRWGGENGPKIKEAMARYYKPYARLVENGTIDPKKEKEIMIKIFVESCLLGWKGIEIDGVDTAFDKKIAVDFLLSLPELADSLMKYASDSANYKEDLGNS